MGQMAGNLGNSNVTNPQEAKWGDLDASEKGARLIAGGTKGLAQGFNNYNQQQAQPNLMGQIGAMPQQPQVWLPGTDLPQSAWRPGMKNPSFYGGQ